MTLLGGTFLFPDGGIAALTGSEFGATLDGAPIDSWTSFESPRPNASPWPDAIGRALLPLRARRNRREAISRQRLHPFAQRPGRIRWQATQEGRRSTDRHHASGTRFRKRTIAPGASRAGAQQNSARHRLARKAAGSLSATQRLFYEASYRVAEESNRMGLRLEGAPLPTISHRQMISEGVPLGAIQVPASGQPIILFVEQQTTGGYPKIANVISVDLHSVGQLRPRDEIRFEPCTLDEAVSLLREQENLLSSPELYSRMKRIDLNCDMGEMPEAIADGTQESLMRIAHFRQHRLRRPRRRRAHHASHHRAGAAP